jgi:hypothetical protein
MQFDAVRFRTVFQPGGGCVIENRLPSFHSVGLLMLSLSCGVPAAWAGPLYGVVSTGDVASGSFSDFPTQLWNTGGNPTPVTSYTSPVLSASGSYTFGNSTVSGSATSWATLESLNNNVNMHGYANATISGVCQTCSFGTTNSGLFDINWYDTLTVGGLPNGTPVSLMIMAVLNSSIIAPPAGSYAYSQFGLSSTQTQATNTGGASNGLISQSAVVQTTSGANLSLVASLFGSAAVLDTINQQGSATVDASDTANFYITILTPGASYTSASGLTYLAPTSVPEPGSLGVAGISLLGIWIATRRRSAR